MNTKRIPITINSSITITIWTVTLLIQLYVVLYVLIPENAKQYFKSNFSDEYNYEHFHKTEYCLSYGCNSTAHKIQECLNQSVNPCDDFYTFACGSFMLNHSISNYQPYVSTFVNIEERLHRQVLSMVSDPIRTSEPRAYSMAKIFFNNCINVKKIDHRGSLPLLDILYRLGGWPLMTGKRWNNTNWTITEYLKNIRDEGFDMDYLFSIGVDQDPKVVNKMKIGISSPNFKVNTEQLVQGILHPNVKKYSEYLMNAAVRLGAVGDEVQDEIREIIQFEIALAKICPPKYDLDNVINSYNLMTLESIEQKYNYIQWVSFVSSTLPSGIIASKQNEIVVMVPTFFEGLGKLLREHKMRTVVNYLIWRVIDAAIPFLSNHDRLEHKLKIDRSSHKEQPRWMECVIVTQKCFPAAVGSMYAKKYHSERTQSKIEEMVDVMLDHMVQLISKFSWMDTSAKSQAVRKLRNLSFEIGSSDFLRNTSKIDEYFKTLDIDKTGLLESYLRINKFKRKMEYIGLNETGANLSNWLNYADTAVANAFYIPSLNSVYIPEGMLQHDLFLSDSPKSIHYGSLATVIGHEIWHSLDALGSQFDSDGKMNEWWGEDTRRKYSAVTSCFNDQFSNFDHPSTGQALDGKAFANENMADFIGQQLGYAAYEHWLSKHNRTDFLLPNLNFDAKKLFWISSAQNWCCVYNQNASDTDVQSSAHAPDRFRVVGPLSNMETFSRDFQCDVGSKMNPIDKCFL